jgi:hypothetical protein
VPVSILTGATRFLLVQASADDRKEGSTNMKHSFKKVEYLKYSCDVKQRFIDDAECRIASKCMIKVANELALRALDPTVAHHYSRVVAQVLTFNFKGFHYKALLPTKAYRALIKWDGEEKARKIAERAGEKFRSAVQPFTFRVVAERGMKVRKFDEARREQINAARNRRAAEGRPDKRTYTLRKRIVGLV